MLYILLPVRYDKENIILKTETFYGLIFAVIIYILTASSRIKWIFSQSLILERIYGILLKDFLNQSDLSWLSTPDKKIDSFITRFYCVWVLVPTKNGSQYLSY